MWAIEPQSIEYLKLADMSLRNKFHHFLVTETFFW